MLRSLVFIFLVFTLSACATVPKSYRETTLDNMYPILTNAQYDTLASLSSDTAIADFVDKFWLRRDSIAGLECGDLEAEYQRRVEYANLHFPDRPGWGRSDRKRIYLLYGPPGFIERQDYTEDPLGALSTMKAWEIWCYMTPAGKTSLPTYADDVFPGQMKFIFADMTGNGFYMLLYSSEDVGDIDVRLFKGQ